MHVPQSYLSWMVKENSLQATQARVELDRRGYEPTEVDIQKSAIDAASLHLYQLYKKDRKVDQGIWSWLEDVAVEALSGTDGHMPESGKYGVAARGVNLYVCFDYSVPTVLKVSRDLGRARTGGGGYQVREVPAKEPRTGREAVDLVNDADTRAAEIETTMRNETALGPQEAAAQTPSRWPLTGC